MPRKGLIIVYYGDGKGKTTAAMGLAVRALGRGLKVHVIQFIKGTWTTGEMEALQKLGAGFEQMGKGFFKIMDDHVPVEEHQKAAQNGLRRAFEIMNFSKGLSSSVIPNSICPPAGRAGDPEINKKKEQTVISSEGVAEVEKSHTVNDARIMRSLDYARDDSMEWIVDILILDEVLCAVQEGLLQKSDIDLLIKEKPVNLHLVLTGHTVWPELIEQADLVTEMKKIKHPYDSGKGAEIGIDF